MTEILKTVKNKFLQVEEFKPGEGKKLALEGLCLAVAPEDVYGVCQLIKEEPEINCDFLNFVTAVDRLAEDKFELVYYFYSLINKHTVWVKSFLPRTKPVISSIVPLYTGADWQEREIYDLFGIEFKGHPNLKRILLWENYPGYPLRKDYKHIPDRYDSGAEIGIMVQEQKK